MVTPNPINVVFVHNPQDNVVEAVCINWFYPEPDNKGRALVRNYTEQGFGAAILTNVTYWVHADSSGEQVIQLKNELSNLEGLNFNFVEGGLI